MTTHEVIELYFEKYLAAILLGAREDAERLAWILKQLRDIAKREEN